MYRCVVWMDRWPASSCTSRNEPPALCTTRAARVTNVRRPECDEQPFRPMFFERPVEPHDDAERGQRTAALGRNHMIACRGNRAPGGQSRGKIGMKGNGPAAAFLGSRVAQFDHV